MNIKNLTPSEINRDTINFLALATPLVRLKGDDTLYRLCYSSGKGPNAITLMPESSKDHNGFYWSATYHSAEDYGKDFEIVEIIHD